MAARCPRCATPPHPGARYCQACGTRCRGRAARRRRGPLLGVGVCGAACVFWLVIGISLAGTQYLQVARAAPARSASPTTPAAATRPAVSAAASSGAGIISGRVTAEGGRALPEMIVYLESADPARRFEVPRAAVRVSQKDAKFTPSLVVIAAGQAVDFRNDEARPIEHNVFSRSPAKSFDLGLYRPGSGDRLVTFDTPGAVRLFCSIHRYMDGVVYVCPTPFFARVSKDGAYRIENVPPGDYRLKTWQRNQRFPEQEAPVSVRTGGAVEVSLQLARK